MEAHQVRTLLTGRGLVESPRWHGDRLYFSDWSAGEVVAVDLAGHGEVIARVKSLPLCTAWLPDGRLVIVSSPDGRLLRLDPDGDARQRPGARRRGRRAGSGLALTVLRRPDVSAGPVATLSAHMGSYRWPDHASVTSIPARRAKVASMSWLVTGGSGMSIEPCPTSPAR